MPPSYLPYEPQQQQLLPQPLQDWLPEGHLAKYINDTVEDARYEGGGSRNQPFHPSMMVKVLNYGYATGVFSSRKIARKPADARIVLPRSQPQRLDSSNGRRKSTRPVAAVKETDEFRAMQTASRKAGVTTATSAGELHGH